MYYMGGKAYLGKKIAAIIQGHLDTTWPQRLYVEPFCGALNVARHVKVDRMLLNDLCPHLTELFSLVERGGIELPERVSKEEHAQFKAAPPSPLRTFVGFGCSFGGDFFAGYARAGERNFAAESARVLRKKLADLSESRITWSALTYDVLVLEEPSLVYCDPPYAGTRGYKAVGGQFDHEAFWEWCREKTREGHTVLVSEESAPDDFLCSAEWPYTRGLKGDELKGEKRVKTERLFTYTPLGGK